MIIEHYLDSHLVLQIGNVIPGYICCEVIVDRPNELISAINGSCYYISEIRWWEHAEIATGSKIGYGGARDPRNPDSHFFAETDICKTFNCYTQADEYERYLDEIKKSHPDLDLYPAFDIKGRQGDKETVCVNPEAK